MLKTSTLLKTWLTACFSTMRQQVGNKTLGVVVVLNLLLLFGDTLLSLLGHLLHVLIEVIDSALEHLLESIFHISKRQAQIILFYSELLIGIAVSWYLLRKAYFTALHACSTAQPRWRAIASSANTLWGTRAAIWFRGMVMIGALGAAFYLFT
jgi:hypothetical protein